MFELSPCWDRLKSVFIHIFEFRISTWSLRCWAHMHFRMSCLRSKSRLSEPHDEAHTVWPGASSGNNRCLLFFLRTFSRIDRRESYGIFFVYLGRLLKLPFNDCQFSLGELAPHWFRCLFIPQSTSLTQIRFWFEPLHISWKLRTLFHLLFWESLRSRLDGCISCNLLRLLCSTLDVVFMYVGSHLELSLSFGEKLSKLLSKSDVTNGCR